MASSPDYSADAHELSCTHKRPDIVEAVGRSPEMVALCVRAWEFLLSVSAQCSATASAPSQGHVAAVAAQLATSDLPSQGSG